MNIILATLLCIIIPLIMAIIVGKLIISKYNGTLDKIRQSTVEDIDFSKKKIKLMILLSYLLIPLIFCVAVYTIFIIQTPSLDNIQERVIRIGIYIIVPSAVVSIIAMGFAISNAVCEFPFDPEIDYTGLNLKNPISFKERKRNQIKIANAKKTQTFDKHLLLSALPMTIAVYAIIINYLLFSYSGILGQEEKVESDEYHGDEDESPYAIEINETNINDVERGGWIFIACVIPTALSGFLPLKIKGDIKDRRIFTKKIIVSVIGTLPTIIGVIILISTIFASQ